MVLRSIKSSSWRKGIVNDGFAGVSGRSGSVVIRSARPHKDPERFSRTG